MARDCFQSEKSMLQWRVRARQENANIRVLSRVVPAKERSRRVREWSEESRRESRRREVYLLTCVSVFFGGLGADIQTHTKESGGGAKS